ncbi:HPr kinase [Enhygromyxa salina]|uniref:HPr kinase n=1 Tax=Enhygromyxa salina TaxID=215803 RepID=A0A0C2D1J6_9BACT|nr:HprK-related kinase B [Enhygromyxa salina]KIG14037.1 HPr kinase [Enhygromyxa salina]
MTKSPEPDNHQVVKIADSVAYLREAYPATGGIGWDFDGFRVWVESNEASLLDTLAAYFTDFTQLGAASFEAARAEGEITLISAIQAEPTDLGGLRTMTIGEYKPGVRGPKEAFFDVADGRVIHKLRTGMWFMFSCEQHLAIGPCTDNPNQIVNFINNRMIQWSLHRAALLGHASAVCHQSSDDPLPNTIAIAGRSGMGKSTLALHLMKDPRLDFLSNDRVMICPANARGQVEIEGVPKHPRINPGTILTNPKLSGVLDDAERAQFEALPVDDLWDLEHKFDGLIGACFPEQQFVLRGRLVGLVLLNWTRDGGPCVAKRIALRQRSELLPALMKAPGLFYLPSRTQAASRDVGRYLEYLDGVEVLELSGGIDFEAGRQAAMQLLMSSAKS